MLREDFDASDVRIVHVMIAAACREADATSPELWRRYFAFLVDGLSSTRSTITETGVGPSPSL